METLAADVTSGAPNKWDFRWPLSMGRTKIESWSLSMGRSNLEVVYAALAIDKELQPDKVKRDMSVSDGKLFENFEAVEARFLRASYSAFVDVLTLATKTIEEFGQGLI